MYNLKYDLNKKLSNFFRKPFYRAIIFILLVLSINLILFYNISISFRKNYSYKPSDLTLEGTEKEREIQGILNELENKIGSSDIKLLKNYIRFNISVENNFEAKDLDNNQISFIKFNIDKNDKYIEIYPNQRKTLLINLNLYGLERANLPFFTYSIDSTAKNQIITENDALKFYIEVCSFNFNHFGFNHDNLGWLINFMFLLIISIPTALGILLLANGIYKFIKFGSPFIKNSLISYPFSSKVTEGQSIVKSTGCCEPFNPEPWQEKEITWQNKLFVKDHVASFLHIPLNMGKKIIKNMELIEKAGAKAPHQLMLTDEKSLWGCDIYIDVALPVGGDVPGAQMATISGTFLTKVFEGPYKNAGIWAKEMTEYVKSKNRTLKKIYFSYTTCPACAKAYGKNYVVLFAQIN